MRNESFERIVGKEGIRSPSYMFMAILGYGVVVVGYVFTAWHYGQDIISAIMKIQAHHIWAAAAFSLFISLMVVPDYFNYRFVLPLIWCVTLIHVGEAERLGLSTALEDWRSIGGWVYLSIWGIPFVLLYRLGAAYRDGHIGAGGANHVRQYILAMLMWLSCLIYAYLSWRLYMDGADFMLPQRPFIYVTLIALGYWFAASDGALRSYILPVWAGLTVVLELSVFVLNFEAVHRFLFEDHLHELIFAGHVVLMVMFLSFSYLRNKSAIRDMFCGLFPKADR